MRHIHPFPARMAPSIALDKINTLKSGQTILDPMCGSGMVLAQASKQGLNSIGYDLDPLARLISRVGATKVDEEKARRAMSRLIEKCQKTKTELKLDWIDGDPETLKFVRFWFDPLQEKQLRSLSKFLVVNPITTDAKILNLLKVVVSRLIITKEPKASLARDTAHSRPHRTITDNQFDIFEHLPGSLNHVLKALQASSIKQNAKTYLGDARKLKRIKDGSIDAIITSPPYLNAIDYMRGHRLSLVWWGYSLSELRLIRSSSIGSERMRDFEPEEMFSGIARRLEFCNVSKKHRRMLWRYFVDLQNQTSESARVLKDRGTALYVIGNSNIHGTHIRNSELLKEAAALANLEVISETTREIPNNRRYLPVTVNASNALASRMRSEHLIEFARTRSNAV